MAQQQLKDVHRLDKVDPVWQRIRDEAEEVTRREPEFRALSIPRSCITTRSSMRWCIGSPSGSTIRMCRAN